MQVQDLILSTIPAEQFTELKNQVAEANKGIQALLSLVQPSQQIRYLTRKETAKRLKISLVTLNDWQKQGVVQGYRIGSRILFKEDELEASLTKIKTTRRAA